jgi:uncharacterized protein (DUF427 family)
MTVRAVLDGVVLAEAEEVVGLEGNAYFPPSAVRWDHLTENSATSSCPWKGEANYFDAAVGDRKYESVGWTYHTPSRAAANIADHVAFWGNVKIENGD